MVRCNRIVWLFILVFMGYSLAGEAGTIKNVQVMKNTYTLAYSGTVSCRTMKLANPYRFVVDIVGVDSKGKYCDGKNYELNMGEISIKQCWHKKDEDPISKLYNDNVFRVTFEGVNLKGIYCANDKENKIIKVVYNNKSVGAPQTAQTIDSKLNKIERISLREFKSYEMVVVLLSGKPSYTLKKVGNVIYLTINNAFATKSALMGQDLEKESMNVRSILAVKTGANSIKYVINLKKDAKFKKYYSDTRHIYVIFSKPTAVSENETVLKVKKAKKVVPVKTTKSKGILGMNRRISFDVRDAQLKDVFRVFAQISGLNFIIGDDVKGTLTMKLKDIPLDQAMDLILQQEGLVAERKGNVVIIMTARRYQREKNQQLKALQDKEKLERLKSSITKVINLNYITPDYAIGMINKLLYNVKKGNTGFIVADVRNNALICHDTPENIKKIERVVKLIDQKKKLIEIDARIVEISKTFERQLGIQWGVGYEKYHISPSTNHLFVGLGGSTAPQNPFNPDFSNNNFIVNLPPTLSDAPVAGTVSLVVGKADYNIDLKLLAGEIEGYSKVLSSPKVITLDNIPAKIESGQEIPYQESAGASGATSVSFKSATLSLEVTPHITNDNQIILKIKVSKDSPDFAHAVNGEPPINTNQVETTVILSNGQTIVLGGLVQKTNLKSTTGVPGLMRIPLLGWLFKTKRYYNPENELYIFVTPKIVREGERG